MSDADDVRFINEIHNWRHKTLTRIGKRISDGGLADIQGKVGVWNNGAKIPYPTEQDIRVVNSESLSFTFKVTDQSVMFSIWMMTGEMRIGVKVPVKLIQTNEIKQRISHAYDGSDCQRVNSDGADTLFDWIWKDREFASFDFMTNAIFSEKHTAVIIDRMTQVCVHLYIAITSALIDANKLSAGHGVISNKAYDAYLISAVGDMAALEWLLLERMAAVIKDVDKAGSANAPAIYNVLIPQGAPMGPLAVDSAIHEPDGGRCRIVACKRIQAREAE